MGLRYAADWKTLIWLALAGVNLSIMWVRPELRGYLLPLACYLALAAGIIAHNHNHTPTFRSRRANEFLNNVATLFYGFAAFNWIPTHNLNHHKFQNARGDATITWRYSAKHNLLTAATYPFVSMAFQAPLIDRYVKESRTKRPKQFRSIVTQLVLCWGLPIVLSFVDFKATLMTLWLPRFFSLYAICYFNYGQHVHTDPTSRWNHSRNFTSPVLNFLLFNNGYHTVHHMQAGSHWSLAPEKHAEIADKLHPSLNQPSLLLWMLKSYVFAIFVPSVGTHQVGEPPEQSVDAQVTSATA